MPQKKKNMAIDANVALTEINEHYAYGAHSDSMTDLLIALKFKHPAFKIDTGLWSSHISRTERYTNITNFRGSRYLHLSNSGRFWSIQYSEFSSELRAA